MAKNLEINVSNPPGQPVTMALKGEINHSNFDKLEDAVSEIFEEKNQFNIIFDMQGLEHISSVGIGVLISTITQAQDSGGAISFRNVSLKIREIFSLLGLPEEYFPTT